MSKTPLALLLYVKPGCHLCDEARDVLALAAPHRQVEESDITRDAALSNTFGTRIPVLTRKDTGESLDWPFGPAEVKKLVTDEPLTVPGRRE